MKPLYQFTYIINFEKKDCLYIKYR